jgi:N utilization substance protein A
MARENILEAIGDIAREKGIPRERLVAVIQEAVTMAAKRKFKSFEDIEARISESTGQLEVFRYKTVAEEVEDPDNEISIEEARRLDSLAEPGDEVEYEIDNKELSRVIAQTARQLIFQKIREAERETIYETFKDRVGEVLNGVVSRTERGRTFITFNQTEAILYRREQIPHERYSSGDHIRLILLDVLNDPKEPSQLVISRAHPALLSKLFEMEVPEIYDGIVEIVQAAREPGRRAKIAVRSNDPDVDPVGACVGLRGSRVQSIISELRGEKIDIIHYTEDLPTYVANALAPAELSRIKIDEENKEIDAEVEPDQLSLAIGRFGQNVRLASKLLGYKINVMSPQEAGPSLEEQIRQSLLASQAQLGMVPEGTVTPTSLMGGTAPAPARDAAAETEAEAGEEEAETGAEEAEPVEAAAGQSEPAQVAAGRTVWEGASVPPPIDVEAEAAASAAAAAEAARAEAAEQAEPAAVPEGGAEAQPAEAGLEAEQEAQQEAEQEAGATPETEADDDSEPAAGADGAPDAEGEPR